MADVWGDHINMSCNCPNNSYFIKNPAPIKCAAGLLITINCNMSEVRADWIKNTLTNGSSKLVNWTNQKGGKFDVFILNVVRTLKQDFHYLNVR